MIKLKMMFCILMLFLCCSVYAEGGDIVLQIKDAFAKSKHTVGMNISVEVNNGVVLLTGTAKDLDNAMKIIEIAGSVEGVEDVDPSNLAIKDGSKMSYDELVTAKVIGTLLRKKVFGDADVDSFPITVKTNRGIVFLIGNVDTRTEINNSINFSVRVPGVLRVISELNVIFRPVHM